MQSIFKHNNEVMKNKKNTHTYQFKQKTKIKQVSEYSILLDNGYIIESHHEQSCCETHYLAIGESRDELLKLGEFDTIEVEIIKGFGIKFNGVAIAGYGDNNGCYSSDLALIISNSKEKYIIDCTEGQDYTDEK